MPRKDLPAFFFVLGFLAFIGANYELGLFLIVIAIAVG